MKCTNDLTTKVTRGWDTKVTRGWDTTFPEARIPGVQDSIVCPSA
jgi:hypothetical protein